MICRRAVVVVGFAPPAQGELIIDGQSYPFDYLGLEGTLQQLSQYGNFLMTPHTDVSWVIDYYGDRNVEKMIYGGEFEFKDIECCVSCFDDRIGLRGVCEKDGCSLLLNDIGIDASFLEAIITQDYASLQDFLHSQIRLAYEDVKAAIYSNVQPRLKATSIIGDGKAGVLRSGTYYEPEPAPLTQIVIYGVRLKLCEHGDYSFNISRIGLHTDFTGKISVFVFSMPTLQMLHHEMIDSTSGIASYKTVNWKLTHGDIIIGWIPKARKYADTVLSRGTCCGQTMLTTSVYEIAGVRGMFSDLKQTESTSGLLLEFSVGCDYDRWICRNASAMQLAVYYRTAMNVLRFALTVSRHHRVNTVVTIGSATVEELLTWVSEQYSRSISDVLQNMIPTGGCFQCREVAASRLVLP